MFSYKRGYFAIDPNGNKITSGISGPYWTDDKIIINHYWTRSKKYFRTKKIPSRQVRRKINQQTLKKMAKTYNTCIDTCILQFAPALREKMGYDSHP